MKTVSIIIPCYNGERFIEEAILSALNQTYPDKEVIVVDDGSDDNSYNIMKQYSHQIKIIRQKNSGLPIARNIGVKSCQGQYLAFLDCDDWWDKHFVEKMMAEIQDENIIAYCGWQNIGLPGRKGQPYIPPDYERNGKKVETLLQNNIWPVHAAIISKKLFNAVGGFNPTWTTCEDFDLWLRTAMKSKIVLVPYVLAYYRHHPYEQMSKDRYRIAKNHWLIQKKFLKEEKELVQKIGGKKISELTNGEMVRRGFICYWDKDLYNARKIFKLALFTGNAKLKDLKYMLPALLPFRAHQLLLKCFR